MKTLWFFVRVLLLAGLVLWLADSPGTVQIVFRGVTIETSAAVLVLGVLFFAWVLVRVYGIWRFLWEMPRLWKAKRRVRDLEDGQRAIAAGLAAIAGGDAPKAGAHALRARKMLGETASVRLLQAQAAQLAGDRNAAKALFTAMTQDGDSAVLGYRGLIADALRDGDNAQALSLIARLEKEKGEMPFTHALRFRINAQLENWQPARLALEKARKARAVSKTVAALQDAALLLAQAKEALKASDGKQALICAEKARSLAPLWIPAALVLAEAQIVVGSNAALRTIERAWRVAPHPQLVPLAFWALKTERPVEGFRYVRKLTRSAPNDTVSLMALADAALKADLWGEARRALMAIVARGAGTRLTYQMLARLERHETGDEKAASSWLARGLGAPQDPAWLCGACGAGHEYWDAVCPACKAFNKMTWSTPGKARATTGTEETAPVLLVDDVG